jgi:hypothetical protein
MNEIEYKAINKTTGADEAESQKNNGDLMSKEVHRIKKLLVVTGLISIPLCFVIIGFPILLAVFGGYLFIYRDLVNKLNMYKANLKSDSKLSPAI